MRRRDLVAALALLVTLAAAGCASTRHVVELEQADDVTIRDVTIIDGTGAPPRLHQDVVVERGRIVRIAEHVTAPPRRTPGGPLIVDGRGLTLLPGFVDAHVHVDGDGAPRGVTGLSVEENLERLVRVGVTTAFDMGGDAETMRTLAHRVAEGTLAGPRLKHTHLVITAKDGYPLSLADELMAAPAWLVRLALPQVGGPDDIDTVLDEIDDAAVDFVKIMVDRVPPDEPMLDEALLVALIQEARRREHVVVVHAGDVDAAVVAARAGAAMLAHLPRRGRFTAEQIQVLKDSGVVIVTTAAMWESSADVLQGAFKPGRLDRALVPADVLAATGQAPTAAVLHVLRDDLIAARADRAANLSALVAAGVPLVVGTDSSIPGTWAGSSYEKEQAALLAAGLSPMQLIVAMTSASARVLPGADFGVVRQGGRADLVLVEGDPLQDPTALSRPVRVFVGGRALTALSPLPPPTEPAPSPVPALPAVPVEAPLPTADPSPEELR